MTVFFCSTYLEIHVLCGCSLCAEADIEIQAAFSSGWKQQHNSHELASVCQLCSGAAFLRRYQTEALHHSMLTIKKVFVASKSNQVNTQSVSDCINMSTFTVFPTSLISLMPAIGSYGEMYFSHFRVSKSHLKGLHCLHVLCPILSCLF